MNGTPHTLPSLNIVAFNLFTLLATGVVTSGWILYYTDYFPIVGGLLGLGGLFAWIAFLSNIIDPNRKKQFQVCFDEKFLRKKRFALIISLHYCPVKIIETE